MKIRRAIAILSSLVIIGCIVGIVLNETGDPYDYDLSPYVKLGQYLGVEISASDIAVSDKEIDDEVFARMKSGGYATTKPVSGRGIQNGDIVNLDFDGTYKGQSVEGGYATRYDLIIGSGKFIEGFEEKLIGAYAGEVLNFQIEFPKDYTFNKAIAGADIDFEVIINSVSTVEYSTITDDIASSLGGGEMTVEQYRQLVADDLSGEKKEEVVWNKVLKNAEIISIPQKEIDAYVIDLEDYYADKHGMVLEEALAVFYHTSTDNFDEAAAEYAREDIASEMVCYSIAAAEEITLTDDEYRAGVVEKAAEENYTPKEYVKNSGGRRTVEKWLLIEKVFDYLAQQAVVV